MLRAGGWSIRPNFETFSSGEPEDPNVSSGRAAEAAELRNIRFGYAGKPECLERLGVQRDQRIYFSLREMERTSLSRLSPSEKEFLFLLIRPDRVSIPPSVSDRESLSLSERERPFLYACERERESLFLFVRERNSLSLPQTQKVSVCLS